LQKIISEQAYIRKFYLLVHGFMVIGFLIYVLYLWYFVVNVDNKPVLK